MNPLTLRTVPVLVHVRVGGGGVHILGDPQGVQLKNATSFTISALEKFTMDHSNHICTTLITTFHFHYLSEWREKPKH